MNVTQNNLKKHISKNEDIEINKMKDILESKGYTVESIYKTAIRNTRKPYNDVLESEELMEFNVCAEYFYGIVDAYIEENNLQDEYDMSDYESNVDFDVVSFIVPKRWLFNHMKEDGIADPEDYLCNEYTSDDSMKWYEAACSEGKILTMFF